MVGNRRSFFQWVAGVAAGVGLGRAAPAVVGELAVADAVVMSAASVGVLPSLILPVIEPVKRIPMMVFPMIQRVYPQLLLNRLADVQPIDRPMAKEFVAASASPVFSPGFADEGELVTEAVPHFGHTSWLPGVISPTPQKSIEEWEKEEIERNKDRPFNFSELTEFAVLHRFTMGQVDEMDWRARQIIERGVEFTPVMDCYPTTDAREQRLTVVYGPGEERFLVASCLYTPEELASYVVGVEGVVEVGRDGPGAGVVFVVPFRIDTTGSTMASATIYEQGELDWCHEQTVRQVCTLSTEPIMCSECGERPAGPGNVYNRVTIEGPIEWDEKYYRICDVCQEAEEEWD